MRRTAVAATVLALAIAGVTFGAPAQAADPPSPGGCKAFGQNVSDLATGLGRDFGKAASGTAKMGPGVFKETVVKGEQETLCP